MKMTKKILLGAAALFATVAFVSCGGAATGDDDPNKMIEGKNSSYSIDYSNETGSTSRGYNTTAMKHAGAFVKISIDDTSSDPSKKLGGVMGVIFGLEGNEEDKTAKDFFVAGVRKNGTYYVSKYTGVVDILSENFGAKNDAKEGGWSSAGENGEKEYSYKELAKENNTIALNSEDGVKSVYFYYKCTDTGAYEWKFVKSNPTTKEKGLTDDEFKALDFGDNVLVAGTIPASDTGYTESTQRKLAVYANVYKDGNLTGNWDIVGTYKEAELLDD